MPCPRIFHNPKPMEQRSAILPMPEVEAKAWNLTRKLHPEYYPSAKGCAVSSAQGE